MQYHIMGARAQTGEDVSFFLEAQTAAIAEQTARAQGILVSQVIPSPAASKNPLRLYLDWAGLRSFIFQMIFIGWTAFMFFAAIGLMLLAAPNSDSDRPMDPWSRRDSETAHAAAFGFMGICCPCGVYLLIALPLGVAAIATLDARKKRQGGT